jgi:uncharacterized damage-inducible protein DinB
MTTFVPTLEDVAAHLADVSPSFREFVAGGQAAVDAAEAAAEVEAVPAPTDPAASATVAP